jgi:glycosyltransferase involved in cell wall biosynthesis
MPAELLHAVRGLFGVLPEVAGELLAAVLVAALLHGPLLGPELALIAVGGHNIPPMARILIASDAWHPQVNGVVRTLDTAVSALRARGETVEVVEPSQYFTWPVPFYPEIRLTLSWPRRIRERVRRFRPDHVHLATEGPIGFSVRRACRLFGWRFTTSYHTKFPEYLHEHARVPADWSYCYLRWFHNGAAATMTATPSLEAELTARGFRGPFRRWSRGVDLSQFGPRPKSGSLARPVMLYAGRVSAEKNLDAFLSLDVPGTKVVVGDGPAKAEWEAKYPAAIFRGVLRGEALAAAYADADVFVFPSRTDTFGIVLIEALASGVPVAAYPVTGPLDIVTRPELGALNDDLATAVRKALRTGDPAACGAEGRTYTWERSVDQFRSNLVPIRGGAARR